MNEIDLGELIQREFKKALGNDTATHSGSIKFKREPIEGTVLAEATCPHCGTSGIVEPLVINKEVPVEKVVEKEVEPDPSKYLDVTNADFSTMSKYLSRHRGGKSLFQCDNCESPAFDWFMEQPGLDDWLKKHGKRLVNK